ncbi:MAG: FAD-binding protein [Pseudoscardovia radai]|nr:FAD-binding protein [Pseudoscardovia radai]
MSPHQVKNNYDLVIVGAGAAGLSSALGFLRTFDTATAGREPDVLVISKLQSLRSHTGSAEGGIAASLGNVEKDDWHWHYYDTVKGGDYLVDQDMARILARDAPRTVIELEHDGVVFSRLENGRIAQRLFGGHTADFGKASIHRTAYAADRIGHQILHSLWQQCVAENVEFAEEWYVTDLDVERDSTGAAACHGLVVLDTHTGRTHAIRASHVILATGGAGRLFHTTSNSWDLTGDGMALVLRAGLDLEDSEFIQFHPTGLAHTGILLSEAARGEGGVLRNSEGEAFMARYAPGHADLAARDVVTRSIYSEIEAGRGVADPMDPDGPKDCVWLDLTAVGRETLETKIPEVYSTIRTYAGIDAATDWVPVKPTAHYTMGGIPIDQDGRVYEYASGERRFVTGLYAAGECSCGSVHGANRLGANSLLDACLFGHRAGVAVARRTMDAAGSVATGAAATTKAGDDALARLLERRNEIIDSLLPRSPQMSDTPRTTGVSQDAAPQNATAANQETNRRASAGSGDNADNPYAVMARLGSVMERNCAVHCSAESIAHARAAIDSSIAPAAERLTAHSATRSFNQELTAILETRNLVTVARTVLAASDARKESRGSLKRDDYPERDDEHFLRHSHVTAAGDVTWEPVTIVDFAPQARTY